MSRDEDPIEATEAHIEAQRERLSRIVVRAKRAEMSRERLFNEISRVELYLIRRRGR